MIITTALLLVFLATLIRGLRGGWYILHAALALGGAWLLRGQLPVAPMTPSPLALIPAMGLHLISINIVTFILYAWDKRAAINKAWRVPERVLFAYTLAGGSPMAMAARLIFRHKTSKITFRSRFIMIVVLQMAFAMGLVFLAAKCGLIG